MRFLPALLLTFPFAISSCAFKSVTRSKNIPYQELNPIVKSPRQELNIFAPRKHPSLKDVLIFVHGGSWNSGKKSLYNFFGSRMARKDVVVVILDYPLSPQVTYADMASSVAKGVQWVSQNIERYGGNPEKIFLSGHSAGGHLAALVAIRNEYFDSLKIKNPIKGIVLIDAAGLDMYGYLQEEKFPDDHTYFTTFTHDPSQWKKASPLYHLHPNMPPMLIYRGEKTYPSILKSTEKFIKALKEFVPQPNYTVLKGKKHVPMMTQFFRPWNKRYDEIIRFMNEN
jgi:acetyl esterase/lipase